MRKLINDPENLAVELIDGFCVTNKKKVKRIAPHVCARVEAPIPDKVGIVIGGGAGHEPLFLEFIGKGWLTHLSTGRYLQLQLQTKF